MRCLQCKAPLALAFRIQWSMQKSAWIWFVGCAVWFLDGVEQLHVHAQAHAELAFMLAMLFLVAGFFYRRQKQ